MKHPPKKDVVYGIVVWSIAVVLLPILIFFFSVGVAIMYILSVLLVVWMWNSTVYIIENDELYIKCLVFRKHVQIKDIQSIKRTRNIYSSFALSVDRLEITDKSDKYYVAPKDFESFIEELKSYNENILVS